MRPLGVIGSLSRDVVGGGAPRIGGGPWHAARALRVLGQRAVIAAKCGEADGAAFRRRLATLGVPAAVAADGETTSFSFSYDGSVRTMQIDALGEPWRIDDVPEQTLRRVEWLHVAPLARGDFDADLLAELARGRRLLLDGQGLTRTRKVGPLELDAAYDPELLAHVSVLKLAEEEAAVIGDLRALGVPEVLVTSGADGSRVITSEGETHIPAHRVTGDPTGAGDAYSIAYLCARSEGHRPISAARRATALVAALVGARAAR